jgi:addiction module HigA family antidote
MNPPITPGETLLEEYLTPMGMSPNAMARAIGVAPRGVNEIVLGHRSITPIMSIRFGAFFGQTPEFWHGLQVECDFRALGKKQNSSPRKSVPLKPSVTPRNTPSLRELRYRPVRVKKLKRLSSSKGSFSRFRQRLS